MKMIKHVALMFLALTFTLLSCETGETDPTEMELAIEEEIGQFEAQLDASAESSDGTEEGNSEEDNENNSHGEEESDDSNGDSEGDTGGDSEEEAPAGPDEQDCSFDGLIEGIVGSGHYIGVNEHPNSFGSETVYSWSVNGNEITSLRPRFVRINDHVQDAGTVEVCFTATTADCGTLSECISVNFGG